MEALTEEELQILAEFLNKAGDKFKDEVSGALTEIPKQKELDELKDGVNRMWELFRMA